MKMKCKVCDREGLALVDGRCFLCNQYMNRELFRGEIHAGDVLYGQNGFVWERSEGGGVVLYLSPDGGYRWDDPPKLRTLSERAVRQIGIVEPNPIGTLVCEALA